MVSRWLEALDSPSQQVNLFFRGQIDGDVEIPALNLEPLVASFAGKALSVFVEGLMQDANDKQSAFRAGCGFGQFLKYVDIAAATRGVLQELTHFIEEED
ncbi:hypothetical protein D3C87_1387980 [compost metagenome]